MRKNWKRWIAGLLTAVMLVTMLPTTAFAALWENGRVHNQEILTALENLCGSKDEAQHYYALLDEYGLLDEDGGLFSNWSGVSGHFEAVWPDRRGRQHRHRREDHHGRAGIHPG